MNHDMHGGGSGSGMSHSMGTFHWSAFGDAIWFDSWIPKSVGGYVGACIGLFFFAILSRGLTALEAYFSAWSSQGFHKMNDQIHRQQPTPNLKAILTRIAPQDPQRQHNDVEKISATEPISQGSLNAMSSRGESQFSSSRSAYPEPLQLPVVPPFVWYNDTVRSILTTLGSFVSYLLMLVVMTGNGGFFIVTIAGIFVGEIVFGRLRSLGGIQADHGH